MANSKNSSTAKKTKKAVAKKASPKAQKTSKEKKGLNGEVLSIILIGASLIMLLCVITNDSMGAFGEFVANFLKIFFGIGAAALPIVLLIFSVQTLFSRDMSAFKPKLIMFIGFFIVFISLTHVMSGRRIGEDSIFEFLRHYADHISMGNGGIIGAAVGEPLQALIGTVGSYIVLITALIVLLILSTGKSFVGFVRYIGDLVDGVKSDYEEYSGSEYYEEEAEEEPKQQKLPLDKMEKEAKASKKKKLKNKKSPSKEPVEEKGEERIIAFNLLDEEEKDEEGVIIQNDFILKNNKIYSPSKEPTVEFTGLSQLINEAEEFINSGNEHYVFNIPEDNNEADIEEIVEDNKDDDKPVLTEVTPIPKPQPKEDIPPWEEPTEIYKEGSEPEIIEAEKTKTLSKLKVEKTSEYKFPKLEFLGKNPKPNGAVTKQEMYQKAKQLENTLAIFHVNATVNNISQGPAVTRYELTPPKGVRVKDIVNLENDIALALAARSIRMEAPIPGKSAIGIEIPNDTISMVYFREILTNEKFQNFKGKLAFGIGKDITGNVIVQDIAKMPHLLIAGSTGSGKSVCINTLITSILYKYNPDQVKLIMIDPKIVELGVYNGIPHLLVPVVTDPQKAAGALNWAVREMMRRYDLFATRGVRNLEGYNELDDIEEKLPHMIVIIDELADLMMVAKKDVESSIQRLTQLARAAGIHLVIATQRPSVNVITGVIKANVPSRIAFKVASSTDSRTILDSSGAEKLLGKGDMLFQAGDMDKPLRIQGAFVTDHEVEKIVESIRVDDESHYDQNIINEIASSVDADGGDDDFSDSDGDDLISEVISFVVKNGKASTSLIQRKFRIGFNRAARIIDELEERGIVGPDKGGTKGRDVLMDKYEYRDWKDRQDSY